MITLAVRSWSYIYVHGALSNAIVRAACDRDVSVTFTIIDGLVVLGRDVGDSLT